MALHSSRNEFNERPFYPPAPTTHHILQPSLVAPQSYPSLRASTSALSASPLDESTAKTTGGATRIKTLWEVLQDDVTADTAYAMKVRQAKLLLQDFQRYQEEQQHRYQAKKYEIKMGGYSGGAGLCLNPQRGDVWLASGSDSTKQAMPTNADKNTNSFHGNDGDMNTIRKTTTPLLQASMSTKENSTADAANTHVSSGLSHSTSPQSPSSPKVLTTFDLNISSNKNTNSNCRFDPAAFEVAKSRARRLLSYRSNASAAFTDQGLALTRAVYKELLHKPSSTSVIGFGYQAGHRSRTDRNTAAQVTKLSHVGQEGTTGPSGIALPSTRKLARSAETSTTTTKADTTTTAEAKRALDLLCGIRAMRRQTEELTVALLHACGEWNCWTETTSAHPLREAKGGSPTRQHLFSDLFLRSDSAIARNTEGVTPAQNSDGENSAAACYEEDVRNKRMRACAALRAALHLPSRPSTQYYPHNNAVNPSGGAGVSSEEPSGPALAFLKLAKNPLPRSVPPPPPTSTQLELFAAQQQRVLRSALQRGQTLVPSSAAAPARDRKHSNGMVHTTQYNVVHEEEGQNGAYDQLQQQLHDLRVQRRDVQRTYDALRNAATFNDNTRQLPQTSLSPPQDNPSAELDVHLVEAPTTPTRDREGLPAFFDTLLASPPETAGEKTRPWMDSVYNVEESAKEAELQTPEGTAAAVRVRMEEKALPQQISEVALTPPPSPLSSSAKAQRSFTDNNSGGSAGPPPLKAKAYAATAAAATRLLSSSDSSDDSLEKSRAVTSSERHIASSPVVTPSLKKCPPSESHTKELSRVEGKANLKPTPSPVPAVHTSTSTAIQREAIRSTAAAAAGVTPSLMDSVRKPKPDTTQSSASHVQREGNLDATEASLQSSSSSLAKKASDVNYMKENDEAAEKNDVRSRGGKNVRRGAVASPTSSHQTADSPLSEDNCSGGTSTSCEDSSHYTSSGCTTLYASSNESNPNGHEVSPQACTASWFPYIRTALLTHAGAVDAAVKAERRAREEGETEEDKERSWYQRVDESLLGGMDADVYEKLSEWVSTQQQKNQRRTRHSEKTSEDNPTAARTLSPDDLQALSTWLQEAAVERSETRRAQIENVETRAAATSTWSPPPPALQKALQIVFSGASLWKEMRATERNEKADEDTRRRGVQMGSTSKHKVPHAHSTVVENRSDDHSTAASRKQSRKVDEDLSVPASSPSPLPSQKPHRATPSTDGDTRANTGGAVSTSLHSIMKTKPQTRGNKVVQSSLKKSFLRRLFSCGGR